MGILKWLRPGRCSSERRVCARQSSAYRRRYRLFDDGSGTLVSTPGHIPGHQLLLVHLKNSDFIILSGDVVHLEENFEKNIVPPLNTDKTESIASMEKIRQMIAMYNAKLFINHDKKQTDTVKLLPAFYG
jgi:N-acyl homoserine lactone hydrolase